jgi:hypothetical protein
VYRSLLLVVLAGALALAGSAQPGKPRLPAYYAKLGLTDGQRTALWRIQDNYERRRLALYDLRLLPSAAPAGKKSSRRPSRKKVQPGPSAEETGRLFAGTLRTASAALRALLPDEAQLRRHGLPLWRTEADLARALGISVRELRFFSMHRRAAASSTT